MSLLNSFTKRPVDGRDKALGLFLLALAAISIVPEAAFAADSKDAFADILTKANGWVSGSAGKLITFASLAMAGIMGVAGFPTRLVVGSLATGLVLSSSGNLVDMIF